MNGDREGIFDGYYPQQQPVADKNDGTVTFEKWFKAQSMSLDNPIAHLAREAWKMGFVEGRRAPERGEATQEWPLPTEKMVAAARGVAPHLYDMDIVRIYRAMREVACGTSAQEGK